MKKINHNLSENEALALQIIQEDGGADAKTLSEQLGASKHYTMNLVSKLKQQNLIAIKRAGDDLWINLTKKGQMLMQYLWPESNAAFAV